MSHVQKNGIELHLGHCLDVLKTLPDNSVDAVVTDPPAGISFMGKTWDKPGVLGVSGGMAMPSTTSSRNPSCKNCGGRKRFGPATKGCECETPDWNDVEYRLRDRQEFIGFMTLVMTEVVRVLKPGGHALVWALPRTSHWTAMACEDAGFEIRDRVIHLFGQGFPKSLDVGKAIDKSVGMEREVVSQGVAVKRMIPGANQNNTGSWIKDSGREYIPTTTIPSTDDAKQWDGWGTALKPACEDWWLLRKPLSESTVAANVLKYGTGAINVDACRVPCAGDRLGGGGVSTKKEGWDRPWKHDQESVDACRERREVAAEKAESLGRFPPNVTHDGSQDVLDIFPVTTSGKPCGVRGVKNDGVLGQFSGGMDVTGFGDTGSAARFFPVLTRCLYTPKANSDDRGNKPAKQMPLFGTNEKEVKNTHPTVKPQLLMEWLIKLITPTAGVVLDCFAGSCSTGVAAQNLGFKAILIEREQEYFDIGCQRLGISRES